MSIETELKLRMTPESLSRLKRHPLFSKHQITPPVTQRLHNVYFDTPELDLHARQMALRVRKAGGKWLQTLKGGGSVQAGLHSRHEWEVEVPTAKLDFTGLDEAVWSEHLPVELRARLRPLFITDFYRSSRMLDWQGAKIEVCMDRGQVKADKQSAAICEVELELKSGDARQLFELAEALLDIVPFELETVSKAEQGFRLLCGYVDHPVKYCAPRLVKTDTLGVGLQTLIWSCLMHFQANARAGGEDAEYLHQMRIALRRLRVLLRMAHELKACDELVALRNEIARIGTTLGHTREWDVFILGMDRMLSPHAQLNTLLEHGGRKRDASYSAMRAEAPRLQRLLLRFAIWMNGDYWLKAQRRAPKIRDFAAQYLHRLHKRYARAARERDVYDPAGLHALRIHAKKLRYSAEFFAALYKTNKPKSYLGALAEVQETLGEINDLAVAHRLLEEAAGIVPVEVVEFAESEMRLYLLNKINVLKTAVHNMDRACQFWAA